MNFTQAQTRPFLGLFGGIHHYFILVEAKKQPYFVNFPKTRLFYLHLLRESCIYFKIQPQEIKSSLGKNGKAVTSVFTASDMQAHVLAVNILITEAADFPDTQTGGIHESDHGLLF